MLIATALEAVADRLRTIDGLTVTTDPGTSAAPVVPMAQVMDGEMEYHSTFMRGYDTLNFTITVFVSKADSAQGALEVRDYKSGHGAKSILAALEAAPTPNDDLEAVVAQTGNVGIVDRDGTSYITLQVAATMQIKAKE